ncbi:NIPSNAP protein [Cohnella sp. OV330]|uniref:NIPSNAP family protein n=1 Tax=Cohnella sp. OV330 TaxID=1855288 RepID=UPI0008E01764|nr:NIPSNAP family protein [Cohnella sp. OV330]SFB45468.1 NIPSNAP protein [Cohnella sp. OV330]
MLYELRTYQMKPGKLPAMLDRFRTDTIALLAKHQMKVAEFWVDADESKDRLYYVLEHPDSASRERNFKAFMDDPEWLAVRRRTETDGVLYEYVESAYLKQAAISSRLNPTLREQKLYEMRVYDVSPGKMEAIMQRFDRHVVALFEKHGMTIKHFWLDSDDANNRLYYVVEHPDMVTRNENYARFRADPEWIEAKRLSELEGPLTQKQESIFMKKAAFFNETKPTNEMERLK